MTKWMIIVAGPNGSGKSSLTDAVLGRFDKSQFTKLNADERTIELRQQYPDKALREVNLLAAQQIDAELLGCIENGKSFYVETVLSSDKYRDDVIKAKQNGFRVALFYMSLFPPTLSPDRVGLRVKQGGHDVDHQTAIDRYHRSHKQLEWFAEQADTFVAYDNSAPNAPKPIMIAAKIAGGEITHHIKGVNPSLDHVVGVLRQKQATTHPSP